MSRAWTQMKTCLSPVPLARAWIGLCVAAGVLLGCGGIEPDPDAARGAAGDVGRKVQALRGRTIRPLAPLRSVAVPEPRELGRFVKDRRKAIALGKALFWDMQVGSDGVQACASCHFHAGADSRRKGAVNPGSPRIPSTNLELARPNAVLQASHFPTHRLADANDRASAVLFDTDDIVGSPGVVRAVLAGVDPGRAAERFSLDEPEAVFQIGGVRLRQVEPRNTPTTINAVFNHRNFWDGRAQDVFNGQNTLGPRDPQAVVVSAQRPLALQAVQVRIDNASLASQAVGPLTTGIEINYIGHSFFKLGKKLLRLQPLAKQVVSRDDSVLGRYALAPWRGLFIPYAVLIMEAFQPEWWAGLQIVKLDERGAPTFHPLPRRALREDEYWQMEYNFALFFGLAIQLYEATLVSDDTPLDRYLAGDTRALSAQQLRGKEVFEGAGRCVNCHGGAELTSAAVSHAGAQPITRAETADGRCGLRDTGYFDIGVRPGIEDGGVVRPDPFGVPFALALLAVTGAYAPPGLDPPLGADPACDRRPVVASVFKTPGLRNVELTAPYFHNGGQLTLRQVVDYYNRGGDFRERNLANVDADITGLGLTDAEKEDLVAFLRAMTDERVRHRRAPFDHPQLFVAGGHAGDSDAVRDDG